MVVVQAMHVWKVYGRVEALRDISFDFNAGIVAVVGHNGSGKTTLLSIMAGLRRPSRGRLSIDGVEPYRHREEALRRVSYAFEKPRFNIGLRVGDVMRMLLDTCPDTDKLVEAYSRLGVDRLTSRKLHELSSGQAQLLALIHALYCDADTLAVLDEPLAHLDPERQAELLSMLSKRGKVVFTTHVVEEAEAIADYILVLDNGRLVWRGSLDELMDSVYEVLAREEHLDKLAKAVSLHGGRLLTRISYYVLVEGVDTVVLERLMESGVILGFKKCGLRRAMARG